MERIALNQRRLLPTFWYVSGIEDRLSHIAELGAETIWISPIYESPMDDFGYDISNFTNVDPIFGTLEDFQRMSAKAHDLGKRPLSVKRLNSKSKYG